MIKLWFSSHRMAPNMYSVPEGVPIDGPPYVILQ